MTMTALIFARQVVHHAFDVPGVLRLRRSQHGLRGADLHQPLHRHQRERCHLRHGALRRRGERRHTNIKAGSATSKTTPRSPPWGRTLLSPDKVKCIVGYLAGAGSGQIWCTWAKMGGASTRLGQPHCISLILSRRCFPWGRGHAKPLPLLLIPVETALDYQITGRPPIRLMEEIQPS